MTDVLSDLAKLLRIMRVEGREPRDIVPRLVLVARALPVDDVAGLIFDAAFEIERLRKEVNRLLHVTQEPGEATDDRLRKDFRRGLPNRLLAREFGLTPYHLTKKLRELGEIK